jgi:hypothetical protein
MKTRQSFFAALLWALLSTAAFAQLADQYKYIITGGVSPIGPSFTATKNGSTTVKTDESIQTVISAIIADAMANALGPGIGPPFNIGIQFGNGTNVLDIGQATASFFINGPGTLGMNKINFSGKITSTAPVSAAGSPSGTVIIGSGFSVESSADIANTTAGGNAICITGGEVKIFGGTVESTNTGYAIDFPINGGYGTVVLGGSPTIRGTMQVKAEALSIATDTAFNPGRFLYTLKILGDAAGIVAVKGGANFISNFTLADSPNLILAKKDNDLVLAVSTSSYVITGSGEQFTVTKNGTQLPLTTQSCFMYALCPVLTTIRNDASGSDVSIWFGNGSVLDIGQQRALFINSGAGGEWGNITISGKITSKLGASMDQECGGTVDIERGVSVTSTADISNTYEYNNQEGGSAICIDGGELKILGGTVASTNSGYAIQTQMRGSTVILGGSPTITGRIQVPKGKLSVADGFAPAGKQYTLTMSGAAGDVAVVGGANFISNFTLANSSNLILAKKDNDLVFAVPTSSSSSLVSSSSSAAKSSSSVALSSSSAAKSSSSVAHSSSSTAKSSSSVAPSSSSAAKSSSSVVPSSSSAAKSSSSVAPSSSSAAKSSNSVAPSSNSTDDISSSSEVTPIAHYSPTAAHSEIPTYYTMKGEPVGSTKPAKPGVYLVKQGGAVRKVVVR